MENQETHKKSGIGSRVRTYYIVETYDVNLELSIFLHLCISHSLFCHIHYATDNELIDLDVNNMWIYVCIFVSCY